MKVDRISIQDFRGIKNLKLDALGQLVLLTGPNGTGKSSVLEAIIRWKESVGPYFRPPPIQGALVRVGAETAEIEVQVSVTASEKAFLVRRGVFPSEDAVPNALSGSVGLNAGGSVYRREVEPGLQELLQTWDVPSVGVFEYLGPYRRLPPGWQDQISVNPIDAEVDMQSRLYNVEGKYSYIKQYLLALSLRDLKHFKDTGDSIDSLAGLKSVFDDFFAPKKLLGPDWVSTPQGTSFRILVETPLGAIDVDQLSAGEQEIFSVFGNLDRLRLAGSVLLYDEPELHLNGSLERRLIPALEQLVGNTQLIIASHSAQMSASAPLESIVAMRMGGENQASKIEDENDRIEVFRLLGADVPVQLVARLLVFLEGEESSLDITLMRRLLGRQLPGVEFVVAGPANAIEAVSSRAGALMSQAARYEQFFAVRDRDFLPQADVDRLVSDVEGRLHIWSRYHIENYLLVDEAISRALLRVGVSRSAEEVAADLRGLADDLRETVTGQMLAASVNARVERFDLKVGGGEDPVQITKDKIERSRDSFVEQLGGDRLESLVTEVRREVEERWEEEWRSFCPGRMLIRRLAGLHTLKGDHLVSLIVNELTSDESLQPKEIIDLRERLRQLTPRS